MEKRNEYDIPHEIAIGILRKAQEERTKMAMDIEGKMETLKSEQQTREVQRKIARLRSEMLEMTFQSYKIGQAIIKLNEGV